MSQPKIIVFDIETLPIKAAVWSLYPESIPPESILQDWSILCICWKELNSGAVFSTSVLDDPTRFKKDVYDDFHVVDTFRRAIEDVDIIIGQNIKKFDIKKFNTRLIVYGLPPLPVGIHFVDTLTEVRRVGNFTSNGLDFLAKALTGEGKMETSKGLWIRALNSEREAIKEMVSYCKVDVKKTEEIYLKLLPYMKSHPQVGAMMGEDKNNSCPKCGSTLFSPRTKYRYTVAGVPRIQRQCACCNSYSTFIDKETSGEVFALNNVHD